MTVGLLFIAVGTSRGSAVHRRHEESHEDALDHRRNAIHREAGCRRLRGHGRFRVSRGLHGIAAPDAAEVVARSRRLAIAKRFA